MPKNTRLRLCQLFLAQTGSPSYWKRSECIFHSYLGQLWTFSGGNFGIFCAFLWFSALKVFLGWLLRLIVRQYGEFQPLFTLKSTPNVFGVTYIKCIPETAKYGPQISFCSCLQKIKIAVSNRKKIFSHGMYFQKRQFDWLLKVALIWLV